MRAKTSLEPETPGSAMDASLPADRVAPAAGAPPPIASNTASTPFGTSLSTWSVRLSRYATTILLPAGRN
jgi:hypothetical protein